MRARNWGLVWALAWAGTAVSAQDVPPPPVDPPAGAIMPPKVELGAPVPPKPTADAPPPVAKEIVPLPPPAKIPAAISKSAAAENIPAAVPPNAGPPPAAAKPAGAAEAIPKAEAPKPAGTAKAPEAGVVDSTKPDTPERVATDLAEIAAALETAKDLKPEERQLAADWAKEAAGHLKDVKLASDYVANRTERANKAPQEEKEQLAAWKLPVALPGYVPSSGAALADLRRDVAAERGALAKEKAASGEHDRARANRDTRVGTLPTERSELEKKVAEARKARSVRAGLMRRAERARDRARTFALEAQLAKLEAEQRVYDAAPRLPQVRADVSQRIATQRAKRLRDAESALAAALKDEARQAAEAAAARVLDPALRHDADRNRELAAERAGAAGPAALAETALKRRDVVEQLLGKLGKRQEELRKKALAGVNAAVGQELRKARHELEPALRHAGELDERRQLVSAAQLRMLDLTQERSALVDPAKQAAEAIAALGVPDDRAPALCGELEGLLGQRGELLSALHDDYSDYAAKLEELNKRDAELVALAGSFSEFITEHVLWQRSASLFDHEEIVELPEATVKLFAPAVWREAGLRFAADVRQHPWFNGLLAVALAAWLALHETMRRKLERLGRMVEKDYLNTFGLTVRAALLTGILSLLAPALLWYVGARVATFEAPDVPVAAFGAGLHAAAWVIASLELCRQLCRRRGLAEAHFRWRPGATALLRRYVNVLLPLSAPLAFIVGATQGQPNEQWQNSLGRLAFIVGMAAFAVASARLFRPHGTLAKDGFRDSSAAGKLALFLVAFGTPAALAAMAELGYYFTAYQLSLRLLPSLWAATVAAMAYALALRWANTARGTLALQRAAAKRRGDAKHPQEQGLDIATINLHTRRLARTGLIVAVACGLWGLWADVLPAFKGLADYTLWTLPAELSAADAAVPAAAPAAKPGDAKPVEAKPLSQDIQIRHLALALAVLWLTFSLGRSAPGMVEVVLASGGRGDPGFRYALAALLRYAIGFVGLLFCARALGLHWANVQWLVAGMTVGLGFGLQEIFANFISGLILLFERPIRLGDTVTVGDLTGTVTKLRIRATTITDGAHRELVVPNKEFITGKLINWTLSDRSARVQVSVAVAYGTDPELAMRTLLDVAAAHPTVLKEPPPSATFEGFGANGLEFKLSAYVANLDDAGGTKHALNTAIVHAFRDAEIECAQPRCDVVVRGFDGDAADYGGLLAARRSA